MDADILLNIQLASDRAQVKVLEFWGLGSILGLMLHVINLAIILVLVFRIVLRDYLVFPSFTISNTKLIHFNLESGRGAIL